MFFGLSYVILEWVKPMLVENMTFRELDRKWFLLEKPKDIKRMNKLFHFKNKKYPVLVYSYIDHESGISMRVLGPIELKEKETYLNKKRIDKKLDIIRYSEMEKLELSPVEDYIAEHIHYTDLVKEEMESYYTPYESVLKTRASLELDPYRDPVVPDDVKFLVITPDHKKEFLEGKIESYEEDKQYYIVIVLADPKQDFDLRAGDRVLLKYVDRPNYQGLAFMKKYLEKANTNP